LQQVSLEFSLLKWKSGSRRYPRVQIIPLDYLEIHARESSGSLETFICLIISNDKNRVVALAAGPTGWCGGWTQIFIIILKILRRSLLKIYVATKHDFYP
jgi:hypothetical protein